MSGMIRPLVWTGDCLRLLDQRRLPQEVCWLECRTVTDVAAAIRDMAVRGAPAIGVAAAYGYALGALAPAEAEPVSMAASLADAARLLLATRPTAVNLAWAIRRMESVTSTSPTEGAAALAARLVAEADAISREDEAVNRRLGENGAHLLPDGGVLTHCNAGALATVGYGTALGVIRAAVAAGRRLTVYVGETRPYLQGARLTAWELVREGIDTVLITDNAAAAVMAAGLVGAVVVGADRIAANGDTANKIGTYGLAILAQEHGIPFYVAAPRSTIDPATPGGRGIPIEERPPEEVTHLAGRRVAAEGVRVFNPSFDVTPATYITAIITEDRVFSPPYDFAPAAHLTPGGSTPGGRNQDA